MSVQIVRMLQKYSMLYMATIRFLRIPIQPQPAPFLELPVCVLSVSERDPEHGRPVSHPLIFPRLSIAQLRRQTQMSSSIHAPRME